MSPEAYPDELVIQRYMNDAALHAAVEMVFNAAIIHAGEVTETQPSEQKALRQRFRLELARIFMSFDCARGAENDLGLVSQRIAYDMMGDEPKGHPQTVMQRLAKEFGFTILGSVPQSAGSQWWFWIEHRGIRPWPSYIRVLPWTPVGTV